MWSETEPIPRWIQEQRSRNFSPEPDEPDDNEYSAHRVREWLKQEHGTSDVDWDISEDGHESDEYRPQEIPAPSSDGDSPYILPEVPRNLPPLPESLIKKPPFL